MDWFTVIMMAVALAMDCCAVSAVQGLHQRKWSRKAVLMALVFGTFHAVMPLIGYYGGTLFVNFMSRYAPWIALVLLGFLGVKMIVESLHEHKDEGEHADWSFSNVLMLAFATSVDVLATGFVMVPYPDWLYPAVGTIGLVTCAFSLLGYLAGVFVGRLKLNMEMIGGIVLILLGIKIFVEGVCF